MWKKLFLLTSMCLFLYAKNIESLPTGKENYDNKQPVVSTTIISKKYKKPRTTMTQKEINQRKIEKEELKEIEKELGIKEQEKQTTDDNKKPNIESLPKGKEDNYDKKQPTTGNKKKKQIRNYVRPEDLKKRLAEIHEKEEQEKEDPEEYLRRHGL